MVLQQVEEGDYALFPNIEQGIDNRQSVEPRSLGLLVRMAFQEGKHVNILHQNAFFDKSFFLLIFPAAGPAEVYPASQVLNDPEVVVGALSLYREGAGPERGDGDFQPSAELPDEKDIPVGQGAVMLHL